MEVCSLLFHLDMYLNTSGSTRGGIYLNQSAGSKPESVLTTIQQSRGMNHSQHLTLAKLMLRCRPETNNRTSPDARVSAIQIRSGTAMGRIGARAGKYIGHLPFKIYLAVSARACRGFALYANLAMLIMALSILA